MRKLTVLMFAERKIFLLQEILSGRISHPRFGEVPSRRSASPVNRLGRLGGLDDRWRHARLQLQPAEIPLL